MSTFDFLQEMGEIPDNYILEAYEMKQINMKKSIGRTVRLTRLAAIVAVLLLLAITAYAVVDHLGIIDMYRGTLVELPGEAEKYIEPQSAAAVEEDWNCRITESLMDGNRFLVTVQIDAGGSYIAVPTDCDANDSVSVIDLPMEQTLGEYAAQQGKKLLFVGASLSNYDEIISQAQKFQFDEGGKMNILIDGDLKTATDRLDTTCTVYALVDGEKEVRRVKIPIQIISTPAEVIGIFRAEDPTAIPGIYLENLELKQTPLGMMVEYAWKNTSEASRNILKQDCDEFTSFHYVGAIMGEDGLLHTTWTMCQGEVTDKLTIHFYNWDKELIGSIVFNRVE